MADGRAKGMLQNLNGVYDELPRVPGYPPPLGGPNTHVAHTTHNRGKQQPQRERFSLRPWDLWYIGRVSKNHLRLNPGGYPSICPHVHGFRSNDHPVRAKRSIGVGLLSPIVTGTESCGLNLKIVTKNVRRAHSASCEICSIPPRQTTSRSR